MRGAHELSAQALGAAGLRERRRGGSKSESIFSVFLSPFRGYRSGFVRDISRGYFGDLNNLLELSR